MRQVPWIVRLAAAFAAAAGVVAWIGDAGGALSLNERPSVGTQKVPERTAYPKQWTDHLGHSVILESAPTSVASRALAIDHLLFEILPESQIAGVSDFAHLPEFSNVHELVRRLDLPTVSDAEALLAIDPSLLLVSEISSPDFLRMARSTQVPVFSMRTLVARLGDIEDSMELIGDFAGQRPRALDSIARFSTTVDKLRQRVTASVDPPRVLGLTSYYHCFGQESLFEDMILALGSVNVCSEYGLGASEKIDPEQIAAWNPDWIVTAAGGRTKDEALAALAADPAVALTAAGRSGRLLAIEDRYLLAMSHHILVAMRVIADALYPSPDSRRQVPGDLD